MVYSRPARARDSQDFKNLAWCVMASSSSSAFPSYSSRDDQCLSLLIPEGWTFADPETGPEPPPKRKRLSLRKDEAAVERTVERFLTPEEEDALADKCVPKNTATSTKWAVAKGKECSLQSGT